MIITIYGDDQFRINKAHKEVLAKHYTDDYNYAEFRDTIDIAQFASALQQVPMLVENYVVFASINKKQYIRIKEYIKPSPYTVLILLLEDFKLTDDLKGNFTVDEVHDCRSLRGKDLSVWASQRAKVHGLELDVEDRKYLLMMFSSMKEIDDILFQMSFLPPFERQVFLKQLFNIKDRFVWELFLELLYGRRKEFFSKFAEQNVQNIELDASQFNMKTIGGLLYCLSKWQDGPDWVVNKTEDKLEIREKIIPFMFCELMRILLISKRESSSILVLAAFDELLTKLKIMK